MYREGEYITQCKAFANDSEWGKGLHSVKLSIYTLDEGLYNGIWTLWDHNFLHAIQRFSFWEVAMYWSDVGLLGLKFFALSWEVPLIRESFKRGSTVIITSLMPAKDIILMLNHYHWLANIACSNVIITFTMKPTRLHEVITFRILFEYSYMP